MTYSFDGASTNTANIPGSPSTTAPVLFNQFLFHSAALPAGEHVLEVVYNGNSSQSAPLVLDYFIVLNRTSGTASTTMAMIPGADITTTSATTTLASPSDGNSSGTSLAINSPRSDAVGTKVGAALGCLALIALIISIIIAQRRLGLWRRTTWYNWTYRHPRYEDGRG